MAQSVERETPGNNQETRNHFHFGQPFGESVRNLLKESLFKKVDSLKDILKPHIPGVNCIGGGCFPLINRMVVA